MSPTYSPISYYNLLKSCMVFLLIQAVIVFFTPILYAQLVYRLLMLSINIVLSIIFGWRLYKQRYHQVFSYDDKGFTLKEGKKEEISHKWGEFSKVSLARTERGDFSIRLHNSDTFDIPISKFKLNPFNFRSEATKLVEQSQKEKKR